MEYFEAASSFEGIAYEGSFEMINLWEDWVRRPDLGLFASPVFSLPEQQVIHEFCDVWDVCCDKTNEDIFDAKVLSEIDCWKTFRNAAESALNIFVCRGKFSEDEEEFNV